MYFLQNFSELCNYFYNETVCSISELQPYIYLSIKILNDMLRWGQIKVKKFVCPSSGDLHRHHDGRHPLNQHLRQTNRIFDSFWSQILPFNLNHSQPHPIDPSLPPSNQAKQFDYFFPKSTWWIFEFKIEWFFIAYKRMREEAKQVMNSFRVYIQKRGEISFVKKWKIRIFALNLSKSWRK